MFLKNYFLYADRVDLLLSDGSLQSIYFNDASGHVYWRYKNGTISGVKHPGIYLGTDVNGIHYYMHNHYQTGKPAIVDGMTFSQGQPLYPYNGESTNSPMQVIQSGLQQVLTGEQYTFLDYNCQTFVNQARRNERTSEDVQKWVGGAFVAFLLFIGIKAVNN